MGDLDEKSLLLFYKKKNRIKKKTNLPFKGWLPSRGKLVANSLSRFEGQNVLIYDCVILER